MKNHDNLSSMKNHKNPLSMKSHAKTLPITILFEDNGTGISEEALQKIWNPFFTTKETGTGLGLGIVKNIIESHRGEIEIFNRKTGGVTVKLTLPSRERTEK